MKRRLIFSVFYCAIIWNLAGTAFGEKESSNPGQVDTGAEYTKPSKLPPKITAKSFQTVRDPSVTEIQKELQTIVKLHRSLQQQHREQIVEIQRITEQAQAHQKLLKNLADMRKTVAPADVPAMDEALRIEKIRLIQEQARQNRVTLEKIREEAIQQKQESLSKALESKAAKETSKKTSSPPAEKEDDKKSSKEESKKKSFWR
jgi:hypothetical protein